MSSAVRMIQTPYLSLNRSSTPMPYSVGKPTLNCCGGSLSTFGNMKRPVAARAAADAAENAPHASPIHARRVSSGEVSSGSRVVDFAAAAAGAFAAAAPPGDATLVVFPARSGIGAAGGRGAGAGRAACAPAAGAAAAAGATGLATVGGALGGMPSAFVSSAIFFYSRGAPPPRLTPSRRCAQAYPEQDVAHPITFSASMAADRSAEGDGMS